MKSLFCQLLYLFTKIKRIPFVIVTLFVFRYSFFDKKGILYYDESGE